MIDPIQEPQVGSRKHKTILILVLFLAFLLKIWHWAEVRREPFFAPDQLAMDSQEYDRWAKEISRGDWIGSEVFFQAPLYPYFLAVIYSLFGERPDAVYLIQILLAVAGCYALYRAGRRLGSSALGLWAAGLNAVYGVYLFYDVQILKESVSATVACFLLWTMAEAMERRKPKLWFVSGLLCGLLVLLRENTLLVVPFLLLLAWSPPNRVRSLLSHGGTFLGGLLIILTPVALRNGLVGGDFLPTTFQGGVNFYIGNNPQANGTYQPLVPGKQVPSYERSEAVRIAEQELGRPLSPAEVSNYWLKKSLAWAKSRPLDFLKLQLKKTGMFWSWYEWPDAVDYYHIKRNSPVYKIPLLEFPGLSLLCLAGLFSIGARRKHFFLVLVIIFAWMASTVVFFLFSRYRLPVVPALCLLAALPLESLGRSLSQRQYRRAAVFLAGLLICLTVPRLFPYKPRMDLVHYNLALVYDGLGQSKKAREYYLQALRDNDKDFLSCVNLGNLAARDSHWPEALQWYLRASSIEPASDGIHTNLGSAYAALGRFGEAEAHLDRALRLNPRNIEALHNLSVLYAKKGDVSKALEINSRILKLSPQWEPALRFRRKLESFIPPDKPPARKE